MMPHVDRHTTHDCGCAEARIAELEAALETVASCFYPHKAEYPVRLEEFYIDTAKLRDAFVQARAALKGETHECEG